MHDGNFAATDGAIDENGESLSSLNSKVNVLANKSGNKHQEVGESNNGSSPMQINSSKLVAPHHNSDLKAQLIFPSAKELQPNEQSYKLKLQTMDSQGG